MCIRDRGKTAYFLYANLEYASASGMSYLALDTKGDLARNYGAIASRYLSLIHIYLSKEALSVVEKMEDILRPEQQEHGGMRFG